MSYDRREAERAYQEGRAGSAGPTHGWYQDDHRRGAADRKKAQQRQRDTAGPDGGGGGAPALVFLAMGPFLVVLGIPSLVSAWLLQFVLRVPEGEPPPAWGQRFKAAFFATLAGSIPGAGVAVAATGLLDPLALPDVDLGRLLVAGGAAAGLSLVLQLLSGGLALKLCLPAAFRGFGGYVRASLTSLLVAVVLGVAAGLLALLVSTQA